MNEIPTPQSLADQMKALRDAGASQKIFLRVWMDLFEEPALQSLKGKIEFLKALGGVDFVKLD